MTAIIIKAEVFVICRCRSLTQITQTEALIISLLCENRRNPIIVLFYKYRVEAFRYFTEMNAYKQHSKRLKTFEKVEPKRLSKIFKF